MEELNMKQVFGKEEKELYLQIIALLANLGAPSFSQLLKNPDDAQIPVSSISATDLPDNLALVLFHNNIQTLGNLLDINRVEFSDFKGCGPKKWLVFHDKQKALFCKYANPSPSSESDVEEEEITPFSIDELFNIHHKMLNIELETKDQKAIVDSEYNKFSIELRKRGQKRSDIFKEEELGAVPFSIYDENARVKTLIDHFGYKLLVQVLDLTMNDIRSVRGKGDKSWEDVVKLKQKIEEEKQYFIDKYNKYCVIRELPTSEKDLPLYEKYLLALNQMADSLEARGNARDAFILKELFIKGTDNELIGNSLYKNKINKKNLTRERIRQISEGMRMQLLSGCENPILNNVYFSEDFINELYAAADQMLYWPLSHVNEVLQAPSDFDSRPFLKLMNFEVLVCSKYKCSFMDNDWVILSNGYNNYVTSHIKAVYNTMANMPMPASMEEIISEVMNHKDLPNQCDVDLLDSIISHHSWIDHCKDDKYALRYDKLANVKVQAARIVYEEKSILTPDLNNIHKKRTQSSKRLNVSVADVNVLFPWVIKGARDDEWVYSPNQSSRIPPIDTATEEYAKKHILFKFDEMVAYLKSIGYDKYADASIRISALKCCLSSTKDKNILCLESEAKKNNPSMWNSRKVQGTTNWLINSCIKFLGDKKLKLKDLSKLVFSQPEAENYNARNLYNIFNSLGKYCCTQDNYSENKPFVMKEEEIWVNQKCIDEGLVDLKTIGNYQHPDYYMDVITEIVNQLKAAEGNRLKLTFLRDKCSHIVTQFSTISNFYKIVNQLPDEVEKVEVDGDIYLQLKQEKLTLEKTYSMPAESQAGSADVEIEAPLVIETTKPEKIYVRGKIDWNDMVDELQRELDFYTRWWDVKGVTLNEGISRFISFLKNSNDNVLHDDLSRHIFEFLTQKVDKYDLHDHLKSISLGLEPILRRMYMHNNRCSSAPLTNGLSGCIALIPDLEEWTKYYSPSDFQDFKKIYYAYYRVRNKFAHGSDIEMNTVAKYQATFSYLALYTYIYNRFID